MSRKSVLLAAIVMTLCAGCSRLGTGLPDCEVPPENPNAAIVLSVQAVPKADYSPCLHNLPLGWEEVDFEVESDLVRLDFEHGNDSFLEVRLTPSCDVGDAKEVPSGFDAIRRYENVSDRTKAISVNIVPSSERAKIHALSLADQLGNAQIDDRRVLFTVDEAVADSVLARVTGALLTNDYVWIVGDLDIDEGTLEMRATSEGEGRRGISVEDALDLIEDTSGDLEYEGEWFFTFEGGCIEYDFDADGRLALTVAADAEETIGFYGNEALREAAERFGYDISPE